MIGTSSRNRAIGLLGGSFNPAHDGHLMISLIALKRLQLDEVWWLVSPQNPLKPALGMAPFAQRLVKARQLASHRRIIVSDIELRLGTHYTRDTLKRLCARRRHQNFVWLMGADNLQGFSRWQHHNRIARAIPIAVLDRPGYSYKAICEGRRLLKRRQQPARFRARALDTDGNLASWCFIAGRRHHASATALRRAG